MNYWKQFGSWNMHYIFNCSFHFHQVSLHVWIVNTKWKQRLRMIHRGRTKRDLKMWDTSIVSYASRTHTHSSSHCVIFRKHAESTCRHIKINRKMEKIHVVRKKWDERKSRPATRKTEKKLKHTHTHHTPTKHYPSGEFRFFYSVAASNGALTFGQRCR